MNAVSQIEGLLFAAGHPIAVKKLAEILSPLSVSDIESFLKELAGSYEKNNRGLRLVFLENKVQLVAAPDSLNVIKNLVKSEFEEDLSPAALETLAIIAYKGAQSRAEIENLRGVNCSFILQSLSLRGLIERKNNPIDNRYYVYNITFDFLKYLGLSRLEDLPKYNELYERKQ